MWVRQAFVNSNWTMPKIYTSRTHLHTTPALKKIPLCGREEKTWESGTNVGTCWELFKTGDDRSWDLKGILHPKFFHLLTLKLLQTCISLFLLLNTKEDILKNDSSSNRSSKYLPLCSAEETHTGLQQLEGE